jgi:RimJ/RimL family protein N-acetyltransferase
VNDFSFSLKPLIPADAKWVGAFIRERWGADIVVGHGVSYLPATLPGFAAISDDVPVGLVTYMIADRQCEIVTIDSVVSGQGVGTALIRAVKTAAELQGCHRLWLITTNDSLAALRFYQKRGFRMVAIHRDAVTRAREIKPEIPYIGNDDIPLMDEIELELSLA